MRFIKLATVLAIKLVKTAAPDITSWAIEQLNMPEQEAAKPLISSTNITTKNGINMPQDNNQNTTPSFPISIFSLLPQYPVALLTLGKCPHPIYSYTVPALRPVATTLEQPTATKPMPTELSTHDALRILCPQVI